MASEVSILRQNKLDIIEQEKKGIQAKSQSSKYNWIAPLNLSSSYTRSDANEFVSDSSISISQDVFRSGGIYYQIEYANTQLYNNLNTLALKNTTLYKTLFVGLLKLKKLKLVLQQAQYSLLNSEIEVFLKTQQYKAGDVDITELNRALREKNAILKTKLAAKEAMIEQEIELKKSTDLELDSIAIPHFNLLSKEEYLQSNYDLLSSDLDTKESNQAYKISRSSYLPTVSVGGAYGYLDDPNLNYQDDYYRVSATISMPLDYNTKATLEEKKALYLQRKLEVIDAQISAAASYNEGESKIKNYEEYNQVTKENIELYTKLISIVEKALEAGMKTGYDLKTLQNTKKIDELEIEVNDINIQIELAQLLFATKKAKEYYEKNY